MTAPTSRSAAVADAVVEAIQDADGYELEIIHTITRRELPLESLKEHGTTTVISVIPDDVDLDTAGTDAGDQIDFTVNVVVQKAIESDDAGAEIDGLRAFVEAIGNTLRTTTMDDMVCMRLTIGRDPDSLALLREFFGYVQATFRTIT